MRILFSSALLGLAWFSALNLIASGVAWLMARALSPRATARPGVLLAVRLLPAVISTAFVVMVFLPAHWRFEPARNDESFGVVLGVLAAFGLALLSRSAWRAVSCGWMDYRLGVLARRAARPLEAGAFEVRGFPGVSLAGILRPTILVGSETVAALTPAELDAAISHEVAHQRSRDNLKRFLMFCAPDVFGWSTAARDLEARWLAEVECQADARAVGGDDGRAVLLASALVKVARLTRRPGPVVASPAWSAFHLAALLETRVRRLTAARAAAQVGSGRISGLLVFTTLTTLTTLTAVGLSMAAWLSDGSYVLHLVTESMVTHLP